VEFGAGLIGAVVGASATAVLGFVLRSREFRREQRLDVYGEFMGAFLKTAHVGANPFSLHMRLGEQLYGSNAVEVRDLWASWREASTSFEESTARLRLIASKRVREASEEMEDNRLQFDSES
jgi:hypothetical protein